MASRSLDEPRYIDPRGVPLSDKRIETNTSGRLVGPNDATYIGATHWAAMLEDVGLIMNAFLHGSGSTDAS